MEKGVEKGEKDEKGEGDKERRRRGLLKREYIYVRSGKEYIRM